MKFFRTKKGIIITATVCFLIVLLIRYIIAENTIFYATQNEKEDISAIIEKNDYNALSQQTGISPDVVKEIIESGNSLFLKEMQDAYFRKPEIKKTYIAFPITLEERNKKDITPLVPLKKGDILITFNTRTLDWRHGHSAIVLDDAGELMLEHMAIGQKSTVTYTKYWGTYPAFMVLRHPDENVAAAAAEYAKNNLVGIPYNLFAGFIKKDKTREENPSSHCSHIVWQAYKSQGVDIDNNAGTIVTPRDIRNSGKLSVVQTFGLK